MKLIEEVVVCRILNCTEEVTGSEGAACACEGHSSLVVRNFDSDNVIAHGVCAALRSNEVVSETVSHNGCVRVNGDLLGGVVEKAHVLIAVGSKSSLKRSLGAVLYAVNACDAGKLGYVIFFVVDRTVPVSDVLSIDRSLDNVLGLSEIEESDSKVSEVYGVKGVGSKLELGYSDVGSAALIFAVT